MKIGAKADEIIWPLGPPGRRVQPFRAKGIDTARPELSFVMQVLNGDDGGWVDFLLSIETRTALENAGAFSTNEEVVEQIRDRFFSSMKELVDQWIDSGKSGTDGRIDTPSDRNAADVPRGYTQSLAAVFYGSFSNNSVWIAMKRDGTLALQERLPPLDSHRFNFGRREGLEFFGKRLAVFFFAKFLDSPFSRHIARCDHCKNYFEYQRAPKKTIKGGTFCSEHRKIGSLHRTESSRSKFKSALIAMAVDATNDWKPTRRHGERAAWIVARINKQLPKSKWITTKWVAQNKEAIDAEVDRRTMAKREGSLYR